MTMIAAKDNPFAVSRLHRLRFRSADGGSHELLSRFMHLGMRGAVIGPCGSGKTTLMLELQALLKGRGHDVRYIRLERAIKSRPWQIANSAKTGQILLIDGAEQLGWSCKFVIYALCRRAAGVLASSHCAVGLPILIETRTTKDTLIELVRELERGPRFSDAQLAAIYEAHGGNVRECFRELYDLSAAHLSACDSRSSLLSSRGSF